MDRDDEWHGHPRIPWPGHDVEEDDTSPEQGCQHEGRCYVRDGVLFCQVCQDPLGSVAWGACESCNASHEGCQFYWGQRGPCCGSECLHMVEEAS